MTRWRERFELSNQVVDFGPRENNEHGALKEIGK